MDLLQELTLKRILIFILGLGVYSVLYRLIVGEVIAREIKAKNEQKSEEIKKQE